MLSVKIRNSEHEEMRWTWEGARIARLLERSRWPMSKKLAWIESAGKLAADIARGRQKLIDNQPRKKSS
jgi:hypothetical protein